MAEPAFDTLEAARRLEAADIQADKADAIVEVVNQSTRQFVTVERFDAAIDRLDTAIAGLHTRIDSVRAELLARMDSLRSELREEIARTHVRTLVVVIAANALITTVIATVATIFGILVTNGVFGTVTIGAP